MCKPEGFSFYVLSIYSPLQINGWYRYLSVKSDAQGIKLALDLIISVSSSFIINYGMIFKQRGQWWGRREYIIEQNGVKVIDRSLTGTSEEFFDFHHIGNVVIRKRKKGWVSLLLALLLLVYGIWLLTDVFNGGGQINMAAACISLALLLSFFISGKKHLYLWSEKNSVSIKFLDNTPSEEELMTFIAHINKAQRIRLQQLYMTIDENMSYKEYRDNIQWLWDNDFLSQEEAEQRLGVVGSKFV